MIHDAIDYTRAAIALLRNDYDIVEWATCTACSWSRIADNEDCRLIIEQLRTWIEVSDPDLGFPTYLINRWQVGDAAPGTAAPGFQVGANAGATDLMDRPPNCSARWYEFRDHPCISQVPADGPGVVVAAGHGIFESQQSTYVTYRNRGGVSAPDAMAAVLWYASVLLHELMHLAAEEPVLFGVRMPGVSADPGAAAYDGCWPLQIQAAHNFVWAMTQRYPDISPIGQVGPYAGLSIGDRDWFMATW
ncbi:MAG: hypothetical protein KC621_06420 [Myxococcales bacterium]|nr:hypothetical protein [Myxococcales bacterium]